MRRNIAAHSVRFLPLLQHPAHSATVLAVGLFVCLYLCIRGCAGDEGPVVSNVCVLITPRGEDVCELGCVLG